MSAIQNDAILFILQEFNNTLDLATVKKLCIRSLRRGIGSMDYIDSLLIMEDDLDNANEDNDDPEVWTPAAEASVAIQPPPPIPQQRQGAVPEWCVCGNCHNMPLEVEKVCCRKKNCDAKKPRFKKLCLDPDYLELSIKSSADIRNDRQNNSTRTFRKASYRHYILDKYGYLGKGRRKVAPSCVVWEIHQASTWVSGNDNSCCKCTYFITRKVNKIPVCDKPATCIT